ncbi:MAG: Spy/CpxP family protein refolding chaperone [Magnetococcales bacterium]|nr:Spy/CpxP family protein refolding chaperone [Magnetococcales bacterium]
MIKKALKKKSVLATMALFMGMGLVAGAAQAEEQADTMPQQYYYGPGMHNNWGGPQHGNPGVDYGKMYGNPNVDYAKMYGNPNVDYAKMYGNPNVDYAKMYGNPNVDYAKMYGNPGIDYAKQYGGVSYTPPKWKHGPQNCATPEGNMGQEEARKYASCLNKEAKKQAMEQQSYAMEQQKQAMAQQKQAMELQKEAMEKMSKSFHHQFQKNHRRAMRSGAPGQPQFRPEMIKGRMEQLKQALELKDTQLEAWNTMEAVMASHAQNRPTPPVNAHAMSPLQRMEQHLTMMEGRLDNQKQMLHAMKDVWAVLDDQQKTRLTSLFPRLGLHGPMGGNMGHSGVPHAMMMPHQPEAKAPASDAGP